MNQTKIGTNAALFSHEPNFTQSEVWPLLPQWAKVFNFVYVLNKFSLFSIQNLCHYQV